MDSGNHVPWRVSEDDPEVGERLTAAEMGLRMPSHDVEMEARTEPLLSSRADQVEGLREFGLHDQLSGIVSPS